jgi:lactoylglutathione lyase
VNIRLEHIGIPVKNLERSKLLYCDLLGFRPFYEMNPNVPYFSKFIFLEKDSVRIELQEMCSDVWQPTPTGRVRGLFHLSFAVENLDQEVKRWSATGLKLLVPPTYPGIMISGEENWRRTVFEGPDGEWVELRGP